MISGPKLIITAGEYESESESESASWQWPGSRACDQARARLQGDPATAASHQ